MDVTDRERTRHALDLYRGHLDGTLRSLARLDEVAARADAALARADRTAARSRELLAAIEERMRRR